MQQYLEKESRKIYHHDVEIQVREIFLPVLQVQAAKASPLDETLFVCPECKQVPDSLRQLMDHLNDEHYQEDLPTKKACAMQILRLHF